MTWTNKSKNTGATPTYKTKIPSLEGRGRILTPDGLQILVGTNENLVLIFQEDTSLWNNKSKILS